MISFVNLHVDYHATVNVLVDYISCCRHCNTIQFIRNFRASVMKIWCVKFIMPHILDQNQTDCKLVILVRSF